MSDKTTEPVAWILFKDGERYDLRFERDERGSRYAWQPLYAAPSLQTTEPVSERVRRMCIEREWVEPAVGGEGGPLYVIPECALSELDAAPSPQTTPLPAGFRDIREVIAERESTLEGKAAMDAARARLPQATPTQDEIMRLHDECEQAFDRAWNERTRRDYDAKRAALAAAVGRLVAERDAAHTNWQMATAEKRLEQERAEKAEAERDAARKQRDAALEAAAHLAEKLARKKEDPFEGYDRRRKARAARGTS